MAAWRGLSDYDGSALILHKDGKCQAAALVGGSQTMKMTNCLGGIGQVLLSFVSTQCIACRVRDARDMNPHHKK